MSLEERLDAVERALTDDDRGPADLSDAATREARLDDLEERLDDLGERVAELEAATQALRGYVGNVRSVNREVEQTAEAALAAAERLEERLDEGPFQGTDPADVGRPGRTDDGPARCCRSRRDDASAGRADAGSTVDRPGDGAVAGRPRDDPPVDRSPADAPVGGPGGTASEAGPDDGGLVDRIRDAL